MQFNPTFRRNHRLEELQKWLNFELPGMVIFGISFFYHTAFILLFTAVICFTPYLLYVLFRERKYTWLVSFGIFVALPAFVSYYLIGAFPHPGYYFTAGYQILASSVPLAFFFFYCYVLKLSIPGMLDD